MDLQKEVYLGDGLYASFDGFQFLLRAPRPEGDHFATLEPSVLAMFNDFVKRVNKELTKSEAED